MREDPEIKIRTARKRLEAYITCSRLQTAGQFELCNNDKCDDCYLNYEKGNMGEFRAAVETALEALEVYKEVLSIYGKIKG